MTARHIDTDEIVARYERDDERRNRAVRLNKSARSITPKHNYKPGKSRRKKAAR